MTRLAAHQLELLTKLDKILEKKENKKSSKSLVSGVSIMESLEIKDETNRDR